MLRSYIGHAPPLSACAGCELWFCCGASRAKQLFGIICCLFTGKLGVFLGPQDLYFAIMKSNSNSISVYRTPGFKGKGLPLYTVSLARPSSLGAGLFAGQS